MTTDPPEHSALTPSSLELADATSELAGFDPELAREALTFADRDRADNTKRVYESQWRTFEGWCAAHSVSALPAAPMTVALYLTERARSGRKVSTLGQALSAIAHKHVRKGFDSPTGSVGVERVWQGIRRTCGAAPRRVAPAVVEDLQKMLDCLPDALIGLRDRALLVVGLTGAFRRAELVALDVEDLAFNTDGVSVTVRRSKTDQFGAGKLVELASDADPATCPAQTLRAWLHAAQLAQGAIFRHVDRHGRVLGRLAPAAVAKIVKRSAAAAGFGAAQYAGHSLRAGFATSAFRAGKSELAIRLQGRWDSRSLEVYLRGDRLRGPHNASAGIWRPTKSTERT
jgi:site-specific recombinase XerD